MNTISITYSYKWFVKFAPNYVITEDGKMFNTLRNVEVKKVLKRYTVGFNIQGKFYSLTSEDNIKIIAEKLCF